jgi:phosphosulfolactate phosphohydrolase-like enzyme
MMTERGLAHEIAYAAQLSTLDVVARLAAGRIVAA